MNAHPTKDDLSRFLRGSLGPDRVADVARHLGDCQQCATATMSTRQVTRSSRSLARAIDPRVDEHPHVETLLTSYVDGNLGRADANAVAAHLEHCATCREDVDDLRATAAVIATGRLRRWAPLAAAAAVGIVVLSLITRDDAPPPPAPAPPPRVVPRVATTPPPPVLTAPRYARPEWASAVDDALRRGTIDKPASLAELQLEPDPERSPGEAADRVLEPAAVIIETTRPQLRWTPIQGATYVVSLFDGPTLVAESEPLRAPRWQPPRPLRRGRTYQWQVAAGGDDTPIIIPAPPAPPALFRVLDQAAHEEIESARNTHGKDSLLLGVLYARLGLREEAERELARAGTTESRVLLRSIQTWK